MREPGLPKVLTWRWTPCLALVAGSLSFVAFALLVIPDRIGNPSAAESPGSRLVLANGFVRPDGNAEASASDESLGTSSVAAALPANPAARAPSHLADSFPRRGFSPPLQRPEQPTPVPPTPAPPPPVAATPPPAPPPQFVPPQPALVIPPAAPPPTEAPPPAAEQPPPAVVPQPAAPGADSPN